MVREEGGGLRSTFEFRRREGTSRSAFDASLSLFLLSPSLTCRPELTMRLTAFPPPPPTPMTLMRASPPVVVGGVKERRRTRELASKKKQKKEWHRNELRVDLPSRSSNSPPPTHSLHSLLLFLDAQKEALSRLTVGAKRRRAPGRGARGQGLERAARRRRRNARPHHRRRKEQTRERPRSGGQSPRATTTTTRPRPQGQCARPRASGGRSSLDEEGRRAERGGGREREFGVDFVFSLSFFSFASSLKKSKELEKVDSARRLYTPFLPPFPLSLSPSLSRLLFATTTCSLSTPSAPRSRGCR